MAAKQQESIFRRFLGILKSRRFNAERKRHELRRLVAHLREQEGTLEYRVAKLEKERDWLIQQGTQAAHEGAGRRRRRAAQKLDLNRLKLAQYYRRLDHVAKALFMCETVVVEIDTQLPEGVGVVLQDVAAALEDDQLGAWLEDSSISFEMVQERIEAKLAGVRTGIGGGPDVREVPTETERALVEMAAREQRGDTEGALRVREGLSVAPDDERVGEPLAEVEI